MFPRHQLFCDKGKLTKRVVFSHANYCDLFAWIAEIIGLQKNGSYQIYVGIKSTFDAKKILSRHK